MKKRIVILGLLCFIIIAGCGKERTGASKSKEIVKINGVVFTTKDLWDFSNIVLWEMEPKDLENAQVKDKILNDFVEHVLLVQEAQRREITIDREKLNQLFIQLSTDQGAKELRAVTGQYDINAENVAKLAQERLLIDTLLRTVVSFTTSISEQELKKFYESKELPKNPVGEAHVLHIFVTDNETAHLAAQELASGILFSEVARKYSESPEKNSGGDLGFIKESNYPEFFSAAFLLKEGETSAIIKSDYGYHIFKMVQYAKASRNSYDNVKKTLIAELYAQKRQEVITEFIDALHSNANIQYLSNFTLAELFPNKR